ncbi:hypothetical protein H6G89_14875 [Oscillatoria sp. FACHB-1407]|uniref:hypothetical protein n=1 Tax=Oscillatoria sp. FACHB-1407 TaxID=2692847 RepID=UPI0016898EA9|nr:hypothetical protein [Oscillatoria sp. FACHB-1407]MBD2462328.1 hypothetical protein [Oscillatoria sp. FACHB-1407]
MVALAHWLTQVLQPILVPLCFVFAWLVMLMVAWSIWSAVRDSFTNAKQMHRIPCANCQFFTNDYHLKCTVHPDTALSEEAVSCMDYEPTRSM